MARLLSVLDGVTLSSGAAVMGTGIVSIGFARDGLTVLSDVLLAVGVALWVVLALLFVARGGGRLRREARSPGALTAVAGSAVLASRFFLAGVAPAGFALSAVAVLAAAVLALPVRRGWTNPARGVGFMVVVATESLTLLAASVSLREHAAWLALVGLAFLVAGLAAYALVLARFDLLQLAVGRGDQWIAGGALAIATLACARTGDALHASASLAGLAHVLDDASLVVAACAAAWLPVLVGAELVAPRLGFDARRWSAVFPLGMYAVAAFAVAAATGQAWLATFARVWIWPAFAAWCVVFAAMLGRGATVARLHGADAA